MNSTPDSGVPEQELPHDWQRLVREARAVREQAWCHYSGFAVGCVLQTPDGQLFHGCNVENASYGLTICAERSAVCAAVAAGEREFAAGCISLAGGPVPCGACRQVLYEFSPDLTLLLDDVRNADARPRCVRLSDLLPLGFRLKSD